MVVNQKMIDELGFSRCRGGFGQLAGAAKHIDEGGFANIGAADEGVFGPVWGRTLVGMLTAGNKTGTFDHVLFFAKVRIVAGIQKFGASTCLWFLYLCAKPIKFSQLL